MIRCLILLLLCLPLAAAADSPVVVKIGAIYALTGDWASWGRNCRQATELALGEINKRSPGRKLVLVLEDSPNARPTNAVSAFKKLVDREQVSYILGPMSPEEFAAIAPLADRAGVPLLPFVSSRTSIPAAMFVWLDPETEALRLADFVADRHRRVAILSSDQEWEALVGQIFGRRLLAKGVAVPTIEEPPFDSADVRSQVTKVKQLNPDAIFITSYLLFPKYMKGLHALRVNVPKYSIELDQSTIAASGKTAEGLMFIRPAAPQDQFSAAFRARWQSEPDIPAAQCYDAVGILARALDAGVNDKASFVRYFHSFPPYNGAAGEIRVDNGRTIMSTEIFKVVDSKFVRFEK